MPDLSTSQKILQEALDTLHRLSTGEVVAVKASSTHNGRAVEVSLVHLQEVHEAVKRLQRATEEARQILLLN